MKVTRLIPLLIAGALCSSGWAADLNLDFGLKLRGVAGTQEEHGVKHGLGLNAYVTMPLNFAKGAAVTAELGYTYYTGEGHRQAIGANTVGASQANSVNFQKTNVEGFNFRALYGQSFLVDELSWQAGVVVNRLKSRMDAVGDYYAADTTALGNWTLRPEESAVTIGGVAGLKYQFNEAGALELNLIYSTYKQVTLTPTFATTGGTTTVTPTLGTENIGTLKVELGYVFRF